MRFDQRTQHVPEKNMGLLNPGRGIARHMKGMINPIDELAASFAAQTDDFHL